MSKAPKLKNIFAKNLKIIREAKGLSQEHLAKKAKITGRYVSILETKNKNLTLDTIENIARALGVEAFELLVDPDQLKSVQSASLELAISTLNDAKLQINKK